MDAPPSPPPAHTPPQPPTHPHIHTHPATHTTTTITTRARRPLNHPHKRPRPLLPCPSENLALGRSTFAEELGEAGAILAAATPRSLVVMGERAPAPGALLHAPFHHM